MSEPFGRPGAVTLFPIVGVPEVSAGDDLALMIVEAARRSAVEILGDDVLVVAQKAVSKAEGRVAEVSPEDGHAVDRLVADEAARIVRRRGGLIIAETRHGFVCANAGVDSSNLEAGKASMLPIDPDRSARRLRRSIHRITGAQVAVIISDTFGRAWRIGQTNVAIGVAGMHPLLDYRGLPDHFGKPLRVTSIAIADELASAAELVMGKSDRVPAAIARGVRFRRGRGRARSLVRGPGHDLFR